MAFRWPSRKVASLRYWPRVAGIVQFTIGRHQLIERRPV